MLLFINACLRGEESRTLDLCRAYLAERNAEVTEINLAALALPPLGGNDVTHRAAQQDAGNFDDPIFALAQQFAQADEVVVGAPYWDLAFPAALKVYFEYVTACGVTFRYAEDGAVVPLCRAKRLTYIMTAGGFTEGMDFGFDYTAALCKMWGITDVRRIAAEGIDIWGADVADILEKARIEARDLARS